MELQLRVLLFAGAAFTLLYFLGQIRKSRLQIDYTIFWSLFGAGLLFLGIFPRLLIDLAHRLGFESPANFVYLVIIFVLILKLFTNTIKLSKMDRQIADLAQHIALREADAGVENTPGAAMPQSNAGQPGTKQEK